MMTVPISFKRAFSLVLLCTVLAISALPARANGCRNRFRECVTSTYVAGVSCTVVTLGTGGAATAICVTTTLTSTRCWWEYYAIQGCGSN